MTAMTAKYHPRHASVNRRLRSFGKHSGRVSRLRPSLPQKHPRGRHQRATPYSTGGYPVTDDARKGFLSPRERRTVEAFAEVFIAGQGEALTPREIADNLDAHLVRVRSKRKASVRLLRFVIEENVPLPPLSGPFSK